MGPCFLSFKKLGWAYRFVAQGGSKLTKCKHTRNMDAHM